MERQDQLHHLQGSVQNEKWDPLFKDYEEFQDRSSSVLSQMQGPPERGPLWKECGLESDPVFKSLALLLFNSCCYPHGAWFLKGDCNGCGAELFLCSEIMFMTSCSSQQHLHFICASRVFILFYLFFYFIILFCFILLFYFVLFYFYFILLLLAN